jgi:hypothetical protein
VSVRTASENLFEAFCGGKGIKCRRVTSGAIRTPDYDVFLGRRKVVTEVKEITPNAVEKAAEAALRRGEPVIVSITPGQRVRGKISDAIPQIKARTKRRYPGLLVVYEAGLLPRHVDPYQIRVAMFGFETVVMAVPVDPRKSPYTVGRKYGARRKMTPDHSTSISAIGVLGSRNGSVALTIFHNPHAKIPLPPELAAKYSIPQFKLGEAEEGAIAQWEAID